MIRYVIFTLLASIGVLAALRILMWAIGPDPELEVLHWRW